MKILFLDIDGVLNSTDFFSQQEKLGNVVLDTIKHLDPKSCQALSHILQKTNAKIVISSSWRYSYDFKSIAKLLNHFGISKKAVIGETAVQISGNGFKIPRGREILNWLQDHNIANGNYVALDDTFIRGLPQEHIIYTNAKTGLTLELADKCIEILNQKRSDLSKTTIIS